MKKLLAVLICLALLSPAFASVSSDFKDYVGAGGSDGIKDYAKDMGIMVGVNDFHDGRAVSFPGFDIGVSGNFLRPSNDIDDAADNSYVFMPMLYGNVRLPIVGLNVHARGMSYDGFSTLGGGLKYSVVGATLLPFFPDITAGVYYDRFKTDYYSADHLSASISASLKVVFIEPYVGVGYDYTDLSVKSTATVYDGNSYNADGMRTTLGVNLTPFPFTYIYGSYTYAGSTKVGQAGFGVRF